MRIIDLSGQRFGRLRVIQRITGVRRVTWECECDCGAITKGTTDKLKSGQKRSCGCLHKEACAKLLRTHGFSHLPEHGIWKGVKARCLNPRNPLFPYYGGRGITIVEPWRSDFAAFLAGVGKRPSQAHSLDRINNDRHYEPGNTRWATRIQQGCNRRNNLTYTWRGLTMTLPEWARRLGIRRSVLYDRLESYGWTVDRAFTQRKRIRIK